MNEESKWFPRRPGLSKLVEGIEDGSVFDMCIANEYKDTPLANKIKQTAKFSTDTIAEYVYTNLTDISASDMTDTEKEEAVKQLFAQFTVDKV